MVETKKPRLRASRKISKGCAVHEWPSLDSVKPHPLPGPLLVPLPPHRTTGVSAFLQGLSTMSLLIGDEQKPVCSLNSYILGSVLSIPPVRFTLLFLQAGGLGQSYQPCGPPGGGESERMTWSSWWRVSRARVPKFFIQLSPREENRTLIPAS